MKVYVNIDPPSRDPRNSSIIRYWLVGEGWELPIQYNGKVGLILHKPMFYRDFEQMPQLWRRIHG